MACLLIQALPPVRGAEPVDLPPAPGSCLRALCAEAVADPPDLGPFVVGVDEVRPAVAEDISTRGLSGLRVNETASAGTFYLSTAHPVSAPAGGLGTLSVWARSDGHLARFAILVREFGFAGAQADPESGDTVLFAPASPDWNFLSMAWHTRHADATSVSIALRGEIAEGESATMWFARPYFGPDTTVWSVDGEPAGVGPRIGVRFAAPAQHVVSASGPGGERSFAIDGPSVVPLVGAISALPSPVVVGGVRLAAEDVQDEFARELLVNGNFSGGVAGWAVEPLELGTNATLALDSGALRLAVPRADQDGSAWARQEVAWMPGVPLAFSWRAHDDRGLLRYELVVAEADGERHITASPPAGPWGAAATMRFTPHTASGQVQLRAVFAHDEPGTVWFDRVSLRPALAYAWSLDGASVGTDAGVVDLAWARDAPHIVTLRVADPFGVVGERAQTFPARLSLGEPTLAERSDVRVALAGREQDIDLAASLSPTLDALAGSAPWVGWRIESAEMPGRVSIERPPSGQLLVRVAPGGTESAGGGVERLLGALPSRTGADLVVPYRTTGDVSKVQVIIRYHTPGDRSYEEARANFSPSADGALAWVRAPAPGENRTFTLVGLRAVFPPGGAGALELGKPVLVPALDYAWHGLPGRGPMAKVNSSGGIVDWGVGAASPGGLVFSFASKLGVLDPIVPFPTLDAGVTALWPPASMPPGVNVSLEGAVSAHAPGEAGMVASASFVPGDYSVIASTPGGQRLVLGSARLADRAGLLEGGVVNASRGGDVTMDLRFANPRLTQVTARLTQGPQSLVVPLARGSEGRWFGEGRVPLSWLPGSASVSLELREPVASGTVAIGTVPIGLAPESAWAGVAFGLVVLITLAVWRPRLAWRAWGPAAAIATVVGVVAAFLARGPDAGAWGLIVAVVAFCAIRARAGLLAWGALALVAAVTASLRADRGVIAGVLVALALAAIAQVAWRAREARA